MTEVASLLNASFSRRGPALCDVVVLRSVDQFAEHVPLLAREIDQALSLIGQLVRGPSRSGFAGDRLSGLESRRARADGGTGHSAHRGSAGRPHPDCRCDGEAAQAVLQRAASQQTRMDVQQERIDLAARELAEVSERPQAAANALRESV